MVNQEWLAAKKVVTQKQVGNVIFKETTYLPVNPPSVISVHLCHNCVLKGIKKRIVLVAGGFSIFIIVSILFFVFIFTGWIVFGRVNMTSGETIFFWIVLTFLSAGLIFSLVSAIKILRKQIPSSEDVEEYKSIVVAPYCRIKLKQTGHAYAYAQGKGENVTRSKWE